MKYLLLAIFLGIVWSFWKKRAEASSRSELRPPPATEHIVACAHCGVHQPVSESLREGDAYFCCEAHRRAGQKPVSNE